MGTLTRNRIVPENSRQAVQDTVLPLGGGEDGKSPALIKKGQLLAWSSYSMHRREDLYGEDAAEFKPERWLDDADEKGLRVGWEYLPFNGGPRICIGRESTLTVLDSLHKNSPTASPPSLCLSLEDFWIQALLGVLANVT